MDKKTKIIDCTLRDGGYYNNWDFAESLVNSYLKTMREIKIDYVEIGFRSLDANEYRGPYYYSTDNFLNSLKIPKDLKIGVMVNAAEILSSKFNNPMKVVKLLFKNKKKSKVSLVRIACHLEEVKKILNPIKWLKSQGYTVGINLMQIADKTDQDVQEVSLLANNSKADIFSSSNSKLRSESELHHLPSASIYHPNLKADTGAMIVPETAKHFVAWRLTTPFAQPI